MAKKTWRERYSAGGVCDFRQNYDFFFRWLLNKVASCFVINGLPDTINQTYLKTELILSGMCCITDFNGKLYACAGDLGGVPDEYYIPTVFVIANPVLGSKQVNRTGENKNGVVIFNTATDQLYSETFAAGLEQLINQTATLLADNIISINCNQINSRIATFFTADSEAEALSGEIILKDMYAGKPFKILRSDLVEKINVNPVATASTSSNITELVELHNYIVSNFMQSIGIKSNNLRKRERLITDEINTQNDYLELSVLEILASWKKGFDEVNEKYGTEITVSLNPAIIDLLTPPAAPQAETTPAESEAETAAAGGSGEHERNDGMGEVLQTAETEQAETEPEEVAEDLEEAAEVIEEIAEAAAGKGAEEDADIQSAEGENVGSDNNSD